jgi:WD40 repeat protein
VHFAACVAFSPDGQILAVGGQETGSNDTLIRLWRVKDGHLLHTLHGHSKRIRSVAFSPDGQMLASGGEDETVRLWCAQESWHG